MQTLRKALAAGGPLSALAAYRRFIIYRLEWTGTKWNKQPCNWHTGEVSNAHDESIHIDWDTACTTAEVFGGDYRVGFVLVKSDGFWFLDIDKCLVGNTWSEIACSLVQTLQGAAIEVSVSGNGLHIFGRGILPPHTNKNAAHGLELYDDKRFVALTGTNATGDAGVDLTSAISAVVATHFTQPAASIVDPAIWQVPAPPIEDDEKLLSRALRAKIGADAAFGGKASFSDLWNAKPGPLGKSYPAEGRPYDASSADAALAAHLAFWTRKNAPQMWRLMWASSLKREKWEKHKDYVQRTIEHAIGLQTEVYETKAEKDAKEVAELTTTLRALDDDPTPQPPLNMDDFIYSCPDNDFVFLKNMAHWPKESIVQTFTKAGPDAIAAAHPVHAFAWDPREPRFTRGKVMSPEGAGWVDAPGSWTMNTYIPSQAISGDATKAGPWIDQIRRIYPNEADHIFDYFSFKVQHPGGKINHAIVFGGEAGIGKDSIIGPFLYAVGTHNVKTTKPAKMFERFTPWTKCTLLYVSEAHDLGDDVTRNQLYERLKDVIAAPPDVQLYDDKNVRQYYVANVCGTIITTNHRTALYVPSDDRRIFVAWSDVDPKSYSADLWTDYWHWLKDGHGTHHVTAWLRQRDVSKWNPNAPPPRTPAWHVMAGANVSETDMELADALDMLGRPGALTLNLIRHRAGVPTSLIDDIIDRRQSRQWPDRMRKAGYTVIRNPIDKRDGLWVIAGKRCVVYAVKDMTEGARVNAAAKLQKDSAIPAK